jgi:4-amino-4-deoxy-L-arabinose transferase-like glycosyltransferase
VLRRVIQPLEGHKGPPGYHLVHVFGTFMPWSVLIPMAVVTAWKHRRQDPTLRFALAAVIGPWVMFEIVRTKLPHYMLPAFPPLAYLTAHAIVRNLRGEQNDLTGRPMVAVVGGWAVVMTLLGFTPWLAAAAKFSPLPWAVMTLVSLSAAAYTGIVFVLFLKRRPASGLVAMGGGFAVFLALMFGLYLPRARFLRLSVDTAELLRREGATGPGQVEMIDYKEPSLAFYQGGTVRENHKNVLTHELLDRAPPWLVLTRDVWDRAPQDVQDRLEVLQPTHRGLAYADGGRDVEVIVVRNRRSK